MGSELIGQRFTKPEYFHGRPSAAGNDGYDGLSSGGQPRAHQSEADRRVKDDVKNLRAENPTFTGPIPADLVTPRAAASIPTSALHPPKRRWRASPPPAE